MPTQTRDLHRIQTEYFIEANPTYVTIHRAVRIPDGAGGYKRDSEQTLSPQRCRVVHQIRSQPVVLEDGTHAEIDKSVVGFGDLDIEVGDTFTYADRVYLVVNAFDEPGWDRRVGQAIHDA